MISFALTHTDLFIRENNKNKNKVNHHLVITEKKIYAKDTILINY